MRGGATLYTQKTGIICSTYYPYPWGAILTAYTVFPSPGCAILFLVLLAEHCLSSTVYRTGIYSLHGTVNPCDLRYRVVSHERERFGGPVTASPLSTKTRIRPPVNFSCCFKHEPAALGVTCHPSRLRSLFHFFCADEKHAASCCSEG